MTKGHSASYEIGPILADLAVPLANSLRRTLLSSLSGAAFTSVQIEGVQHEYQDILNVKEDVSDIIQNLKEVRLRSFSDRAVTVHLAAQGEGVVTAGDVKAPGTIEIVNPMAYIATLDNKDACLSMEMTINVGRGFMPFDAHDARELALGIIPIDAIYSPVRHVNFTIERVRGALGLIETCILLEITTDGAISPDEALRQAADVLRQQFAVFANYKQEKPQKSLHLSDVLIPQNIYSISIEELDLSTRTRNVLHRHSIKIVGQLLEMGEGILELRNMGERTLQEIYERLTMYDLLPEAR